VVEAADLNHASEPVLTMLIIALDHQERRGVETEVEPITVS
jgi:hypothetical protein